MAEDKSGVFKIISFVKKELTSASLGRMLDLAGINVTSSNVNASRIYIKNPKKKRKKPAV